MWLAVGTEQVLAAHRFGKIEDATHPTLLTPTRDQPGVGTGALQLWAPLAHAPSRKKLDAYCRDPTTIQRERGGPLSGAVRTWAATSSRSSPTLLTRSGHKLGRNPAAQQSRAAPELQVHLPPSLPARSCPHHPQCRRLFP